MKLFRIGLGLLLIWFYLLRTPDLDLFFSESGLLPVASVPDMLPMYFRDSIFNHFTSHALLVSCHWLMLASLVTLTLGWWPRISVLTAFVLHTSFLHRNLVVVYGVDLISSFFLFYFCFAELDGRRKRQGSLGAMLGSMAYRLSQLQVCIIYGYSGFEKLKGPMWWRGEAIWAVLGNAQLSRWNFGFMSHFPFIIMLATYSTILWEVYFPVLIWQRRARYWMLGVGLMLHLQIGMMVSLPAFAALMILTYSLFLDASHANLLLGWVYRLPLFSKVLRPDSDRTYV